MASSKVVLIKLWEIVVSFHGDDSDIFWLPLWSWHYNCVGDNQQSWWQNHCISTRVLVKMTTHMNIEGKRSSYHWPINYYYTWSCHWNSNLTLVHPLILETCFADKRYAYADSGSWHIEAWFCILFGPAYSSGTITYLLIPDRWFTETKGIISYIIPSIIGSIYFEFQVVEHGLGHLPFTEKQVVTPTGMFIRNKQGT